MEEEIISWANILGCKTDSLPFKYLGVPVGANMSLQRNWKPIIDKFQTKLSVWKSKALSFGGRLTLVKAVLNSLPSYYFLLFKAPVGILKNLEKIRRSFLWGGSEDKKKIHWISWERVTASKENGGLGVGSLQAHNQALLMKWWWRIKNEREAIWAKVISCIHNLAKKPWSCLAKKSLNGVWYSITSVADCTSQSGMNSESLKSIRIGNGTQVLFWKDTWLGSSCLQHEFPNLYELESRKLCTVSDRFNGENTRWRWKSPPSSDEAAAEIDRLEILLSNYRFNLGVDKFLFNHSPDGSFKVDCLKSKLEELYHQPGTTNICWNKYTSIKVLCVACRAGFGRIPVADQLQIRGVPVPDSTCVICHAETETTDHLFAQCSFTREVFDSVSLWCGILKRSFTSTNQVIEFAAKWGNCPKKREIVNAIWYCTMWILWSCRNNKIFNNIPPSARLTIDNIISTSFSWIKYRGGKITMKWADWVNTPLNISL